MRLRWLPFQLPPADPAILAPPHSGDPDCFRTARAAFGLSGLVSGCLGCSRAVRVGHLSRECVFQKKRWSFVARMYASGRPVMGPDGVRKPSTRHVEKVACGLPLWKAVFRTHSLVI